MRRHTKALILAAPLAVCVGVATAQDTTRTTEKQYPDTTHRQTGDRFERRDAPQGDEAVLMKMHHTNQLEIRVGRLAQRNGSSAKVKAFGSRLARDHAASDQKVMALAKRLGYSVNRGGWMMDSTGRQGAPMQRADSNRFHRGDSAYAPRRTDTTYVPQQRPDTMVQPGYPSDYMKQGPDSMRQDEMGKHMKMMQQLERLRGAEFDAAFSNAMVEGHQKAIAMLEPAQTQVQNAELRRLITSTLPTLRQHLQTAQALANSTTTTSSIQ